MIYMDSVSRRINNKLESVKKDIEEIFLGSKVEIVVHGNGESEWRIDSDGNKTHNTPEYKCTLSMTHNNHVFRYKIHQLNNDNIVHGIMNSLLTYNDKKSIELPYEDRNVAELYKVERMETGHLKVLK